MKLIRFRDADGIKRLGAQTSPNTARRIEGDWFSQFTVTDQELTIDRILPPVSPPNIFGIGLNYRPHAEEQGRALPEKPLIFMKATTSVIADGQPIDLPTSAPNEVDFEAELAIVIGKTARCVKEEDALTFVLGYTCINDITARDCQKRIDKQWTRAKSFDTFCPLGPCIVTADAFDPACARIESELNGRVMQSDTTAALIFSCAELISYLSHQFTLLPGTVICTGTPGGVGFARTPPVFLRNGDKITIRIQGIGQLTNPIRRAAPRES